MDRTTIYDRIEQLKAKPEHVRHRVAFGTATGVAGVVAIVWVAVLVFSGNLALNPDGGTLANNAQKSASQSPFQQLVGGVNAALSGATTSPAALTPVGDTSGAQNTSSDNGYGYSNTNGYTEPATTTTAGTGGDQTTISF